MRDESGEVNNGLPFILSFRRTEERAGSLIKPRRKYVITRRETENKEGTTANEAAIRNLHAADKAKIRTTRSSSHRMQRSQKSATRFQSTKYASVISRDDKPGEPREN